MMSKKWVVVSGFLVTAIAGSLIWVVMKNKAPEFEYKAIQVQRGSIREIIASTGVVTPKNRVEIKAPIAGRVEAVLVQEGDIVRKGQILAWMSSTERAALLDTARIKGQSEVKHWEELYKATPLISPISGTIISRAVEPGQTVNQDPILVIADRLIIKAEVDETDIGKISVHQNAIAILDAFQDQEIPCFVDQIAYEAKTVNNVTIYEVDLTPDAHFKNNSKSGMTAEVSFILSEKDEVLTIPVQALITPGPRSAKKPEGKNRKQRKSSQPQVIVALNKGKKPVFKPIKTGMSDGQVVEIISGLSEGDTVYIRTLKQEKKKKQGSNPFMPSNQRGGSGQQGSGNRGNR